MQAVGLYSSAYSIGSVMHLLITPFAFLLPSFLSNFYDKGDMKNFNKYFNNSLYLYLFFGLSLLSFISLFAKEISILVIDDIEGANIIRLVSVGIFFYGLLMLFSQILLVKKKTKHILGIWIFISILNLLMNIILINLIGIIGAAFSTMISYVIACCIMFGFGIKLIDIKPRLKYILFFIGIPIISYCLTLVSLIFLSNPYISFGLFLFLYVLLIVSGFYFKNKLIIWIR